MGYRPPLSAVQTSDLIRDYSDGMIWSALCTKHGRTSASITHILRRAGITSDRKTKPLIADRAKLVERVAELYQSGNTGEEIGSMLGVGRHRVPALLAEAGIDHRGRGKFTKADQREIAARYDAGESAQSIAPDYAIEPRTVQDIARRHGIRIRGIWETRQRHSLREDAFSTTTDESAYWIGFLMADGCVTTRNTICLTLATRDRDHLERFKEFLGYGGVISTAPPSRMKTGYMTTGSVTLSVRSKQIVCDLARFGVVPRKSHIAQASECIIDNRHFWRGVIDGDGCVTTHIVDGRVYPHISLVGSLPLVSQFRNFVLSTPTTTLARVRSHKTIWQFSLTGSPARSVVALLYSIDESSPSLDRKSAIAKTLVYTSPA